jgi:hypothetical protein
MSGAAPPEQHSMHSPLYHSASHLQTLNQHISLYLLIHPYFLITSCYYVDGVLHSLQLSSAHFNTIVYPLYAPTACSLQVLKKNSHSGHPTGLLSIHLPTLMCYVLNKDIIHSLSKCQIQSIVVNIK